MSASEAREETESITKAEMAIDRFTEFMNRKTSQQEQQAFLYQVLFG